MVQTLAALLSWIAMLALIAIAVLVSGVWRPRVRSRPDRTPGDGRVRQLQTPDQARVQSEAIARAQERTERLRQRRAA